MSSAIVVGSGPNGLACAAELARAGVEVTVLEAAPTIGGGTRTEELTVPGVLNDVCSAVHPMAAASPCLRDLGIEWCWPEVDCAHPLDDGSAGVMLRALDETARGFAASSGGGSGGSAGAHDARAWKRIFGVSAHFESLLDDLLKPVLHPPAHPLSLVRFGIPAALPATAVARMFQTPQARALFGGVAAHALAPLGRPFSSAVGMALTCAGHAVGWPVARGGSKAITDALAEQVRAHGGEIETGVHIRSLADLARASGSGASGPGAVGSGASGTRASGTRAADAVIFDLAPSRVADIAGDALPARVARAYRRYKHGPGAFKVDFAVDGGIPWTNAACRRAGTVHVAGAFDEVVAAERDINRGRMPERPFVLLAQQYLADPSRSNGDVHPIWSYAHVPSGYTGDATEAVIAQIERFAPGFRERIVATAVRTTPEIAAANENFIGGDIVGGANTPWQTTIRPRLALDPYSCGAPGMFICSAATPPGAGVHGMGGYNAAQSVLKELGRR